MTSDPGQWLSRALHESGHAASVRQCHIEAARLISSPGLRPKLQSRGASYGVWIRDTRSDNMRLLEDNKPETNGHGVNGNGVHTNGHCEDTDSESEVEDAEPVSATLVLRVVSEPASPSVSRKSSFRRPDQPPTFLTEESRGEQFLQVQVQRSTSSGSINGNNDLSQHVTI